MTQLRADVDRGEDPALPGLLAAIQLNCDISDARHARDATLCTYLLHMRELYRWEAGHRWRDPLDHATIGRWIAARESRWESLEDREFVALPIDGIDDPFDADAVNAVLAPRRLLYGAGRIPGRGAAFFLAELHSSSRREGLEIRQGGRELARGLLAPPAALTNAGRGPIVVRRESLARWCWERVELYSRNRTSPGALHAMVTAYGLDRDFDEALPAWLDDQVETVVLHELGEHRIGQRLGPAWAAIREALPGAHAPARITAIRDHLADLTVTLPVLLSRGEPAPLHSWFAGYEGWRSTLWPGLPITYAAWCAGDGGASMRAAMEAARRHFLNLADDVLGLWSRGPADAVRVIVTRLESPDAVFRARAAGG